MFRSGYFKHCVQQVDAPEPYAPDKNIVVLTPFGRSAATMFLSSAPGPVIFDVRRLTSVKPGYTKNMKTAISLPDPVFEAADQLANKFKVSRSELYVMALEKFIRENQETDITKRINDYIDVYGQPIDELFINSNVREMRKVEW